MGNRCEACGKFVSLEQEEPEVNSVEIESAGEIEDGAQELEINADVRLALNCGECGGEMKEANLDATETVQFTHADDCDAELDDLEIEEDGAEATDDYRPQGRPMRYQKHYYGADVNVRVKCNKCEAEDTFTVKVEEQAGAFEEL